MSAPEYPQSSQSITATDSATISGVSQIITIVTDEKTYDVHGLPNPYLGLHAFTYVERERYAGRERVVEVAMRLLTTPGEQHSLLFITGASGSGKSSLAQAGLLPALENYYKQHGTACCHVVMRPSRQPLAALADALLQLGLPADGVFIAAKPFLLKETEVTHNNVAVLILDQFEELFIQSEPDQRDILFTMLASLPPFAEQRLHIIAVLRADYLPDLFPYKTLYDIAKQGIDLRAMNEHELREAIQRPLQATRLQEDKRFEPALLDRLAQDAGSDATYLPLLQVSLEDIWRRGKLILATYKSLTDAIRQRAEEVYTYADYDGVQSNPRSEIDQSTILQIFLDLVEVSLNDDSRRDVRRRRSAAELEQAIPARARLIDDLTTARLLSKRLERQSDIDIEIVDIIHESLIANWDRLSEAIAERRDNLQQRARFEQDLRDWLAHERADAYLLLDDVRMARAQALADRNDIALRNSDAKALLQRSSAHHDANRRQQLRRIQAVAAILAVLLVAIGWFGFNATVERNRARALALDAGARAALEIDSNDEAVALALASAQMSNPQAELTLNLAANASATYRHLEGPNKAFVTSTAFSPAGNYIISGFWDGNVQMWEIKTGQEMFRYEAHKAPVRSVAFSPDGKYALSGSLDGTVILWNIMDKREEHRFEAQTDHDWVIEASANGGLLIDISKDQGVVFASQGADTLEFKPNADRVPSENRYQSRLAPVESVSFNIDGTLILAGSWDGAVRQWQVQSRSEPEIFHLDEIVRTFSPNGLYALSSPIDMDRVVRLLKVESMREVARLETGQWTGKVDHVAIYRNALLGHNNAISLDGNYVVIGDAQGLIIWDVQAQSKSEYENASETHSVALSPDNRLALFGSEGGIIVLWDIREERVLRRFVGHTASVRNLMFSQDLSFAVSGSDDGTLRIWSLTSSQELDSFFTPNPETIVADIDLSGKLAILYSHSELETKISLLNMENNHETVLFQEKSEPSNSDDPLQNSQSNEDEITRVTFSRDGKFILIASEEEVLRIWQAETGRKVAEFSVAKSSEITALDMKENRILIGYRSGIVSLWNMETQKEDSNFDRQSIVRPLGNTVFPVNSVGFSPDSKYIIAGYRDGLLRMWDDSQKMEVWNQGVKAHAGEVLDIVFSLDGGLVLSSGGDNILSLREVATGKELRRFIGHTAPIIQVAFSQDGKLALSGSIDGEIRLWEVATGYELRRFEGHTNRIMSVGFSPDSKTAFSSSVDRTARKWRIDTRADLIAWVCANRFVPELSREQRELYGIGDRLLCPPSSLIQ